MKFFEWSDFDFAIPDANRHHELRLTAAKDANAKLEREAKVVYSVHGDKWYSNTNKVIEKQQALLIAIEPISICTHPSEKVYDHFESDCHVIYRCECGARVVPESFKVCE